MYHTTHIKEWVLYLSWEFTRHHGGGTSIWWSFCI